MPRPLGRGALAPDGTRSVIPPRYVKNRVRSYCLNASAVDNFSREVRLRTPQKRHTYHRMKLIVTTNTAPTNELVTTYVWNVNQNGTILPAVTTDVPSLTIDSATGVYVVSVRAPPTSRATARRPIRPSARRRRPSSTSRRLPSRRKASISLRRGGLLHHGVLSC